MSEKEIRQSTDQSMEKMIEITWVERIPGKSAQHLFVNEKRSIIVTKREADLIEKGIISKEDIWEKQTQERIEAERKAKVERIGEIMLSKEPKMDEKVRFGIFDESKEDKSVYYGGHHKKYYVIRYKKTRNVMGRRSFTTK